MIPKLVTAEWYEQCNLVYAVTSNRRNWQLFVTLFVDTGQLKILAAEVKRPLSADCGVSEVTEYQLLTVDDSSYMPLSTPHPLWPPLHQLLKQQPRPSYPGSDRGGATER